MNDNHVSRFFVKSDSYSKNFIFELPDSWWSRVYEYNWVSSFAEQNDICLDAACGISHPLKFYLSEKCQETHACDLDERILSESLIKQGIIDDLGKENFDSLEKKNPEWFKKISFSMDSITKLEYEDKKFDKIFCVSVLEHLLLEDLYRTLKEFKRVMKDDGLIIMTFDYPLINLEYFSWFLKQLNLKFLAEQKTELPENAIYSEELFLYCYRALIVKS